MLEIYSIEEEKNEDGYVKLQEVLSNSPSDKKYKPVLKQRRMLRKCGTCNARKIGVLSNKRKKLSFYFHDMFTSVVELRWRWMILLFSFLNVITWYIFGIFWWILAYYHGDLKTDSSDYGFNEPEPCVFNVQDFGTSFLFSLEVQSTLGFGTRTPTTQCPEGLFLLSVQIIFGTLFNCVIVGLVFTKAARPIARSKTVIFSKKSVICLRDGTLCLMFRIADVRKSKILNAKIRAYLLEDHITFEGELIQRYQRKLKVSVDDAGRGIILSWPVTVCHKINASSPLFEKSALDMLHTNIEIVVSLLGTSELTGQALEARTSYLASEILWGHRFAPIYTSTSRNYYKIDYERFESVVRVDTPVCSSRQISCVR